MMSQPLSQQLRLADLFDGIATVSGGNPPIGGLAMDSRLVRPGDLFLACRGLTSHGLSFASDAIDRGAVAIAWEPDGLEAVNLPLPTVRVARLAERAGEIAARFYGHPSASLGVIGITGTNGKTSIAHYIAQSFDRPGDRAGIIGTLGTGLYGEVARTTHTTPDAVTNQRLLAECLARGASRVAMEVSSHALDQGRVGGVRFSTAVFTNLSHDHLDYHGSLEAYAAAKRKLFSWPELEAAVVNVDDAVGREILASLPDGVRKVACSLQGPVGGVLSFWASEIGHGARGMDFRLHTPWGDAMIESRLVGRFNVANMLATAAVLQLDGRPFDDVVEALRALQPVCGRMETFGGDGQPLVVVDYAHTPDALRQVLEAVRPHAEHRVICVFGCGGDRDTAKRPLMGRIAEQLADITILTNDNPRSEQPERIVADIRAGLAEPDLMPVMLDRKAAIEAALALADTGDVVLIAGKGHEDYQIIGTQRFPFSDRDVVRAWLEGRR